MKKYEAMVIFDSSMSEEGLGKALVRLKDEIVKLKGDVSESKLLGKRAFARQLKKKDDGLYIKLPFQLEPTSVTALLARLKLNEDIFRVQITAVVDRKEKK